MKNIIFFPDFSGASKFLRLRARFPSIASERFLVVVLPLKFTNVDTNRSSIVIKNSLVITDLPTPVSPINRAFLLFYIKRVKRYLNLVVSFVGTRMSKNSILGLYSKIGICSLQDLNSCFSESIPNS